MPDEPGDLLSSLSTVELASAVVERMAEDVPPPSAELPDSDLPFVVLGERAKGLYANFLHSMSSPAEFAPLLAIRPLVELAILVKWISLDPSRHGFLWLANSDASELTHLDAVLNHAKLRGSPEPQLDPRHRSSREEMRNAALEYLKDADRNYGKNRVMPSVIRMVEEVEKAIPGHKIAMRDAYEYAYRTFSPWEHSDATSFNSTGQPTEGQGWVCRGDGNPFATDAIRAIAASMYAYILEVIFGQLLNRESVNMARLVRDYVTTRWVPPIDGRQSDAQPDAEGSEQLS